MSKPKRRRKTGYRPYAGPSLCSLIEEGIKDEAQGQKYWLKVNQALTNIDSPEAPAAEFAAVDEGTHKILLEKLQRKYCG